MAEKYVYRFEEGSKDDRARLGGKGANLAEMTRVGLPVPPGFVVTTNGFRRALQALDPDGEVAARIAGLDPDDHAAVGAATGPRLSLARPIATCTSSARSLPASPRSGSPIRRRGCWRSAQSSPRSARACGGRRGYGDCRRLWLRGWGDRCATRAPGAHNRAAPGTRW